MCSIRILWRHGPRLRARRASKCGLVKCPSWDVACASELKLVVHALFTRVTVKTSHRHPNPHKTRPGQPFSCACGRTYELTCTHTPNAALWMFPPVGYPRLLRSHCIPPLTLLLRRCARHALPIAHRARHLSTIRCTVVRPGLVAHTIWPSPSLPPPPLPLPPPSPPPLEPNLRACRRCTSGSSLGWCTYPSQR